MKGYPVDVVIKPWEEGAYLVEVPALQGCWCVIKSRQTIGKALEDIQDVIQMTIDARKKEGKAAGMLVSRPAPQGAESRAT